jgi:menaquinol-cytochrome c reductase cytochrome b/c subunit
MASNPPNPAAATRPANAASTADANRRGALAAVAAKERPSLAAQATQQLVYVWPHLVLIEFLASVLMMLSLILLGTFVNAPLIGHANADRTPNPSKAPWYFLNLQELLLHMHPALAGVIVPSVVVFVAIPLIPYLDRDTRDVGKWFGTPKAVPIAIFSAIFTAIVIPLEIFFDEYIGIKPPLTALARSTGLHFLADVTVTGVILPLVLMLGPIFIMMRLIRWIYWPYTIRDVMIALWTGFVVAFVLLTIFGTFFRGQGMHLYWLGDPRLHMIE